MLTNKNKIALVAFELSLQAGFDNVSVKEISEKSEIAVGSIYYHFKDKDEILLYMVQMYLMDNFQEFKESVKNFEGSFLERVDFILNYKTSSFIKEEEELYFSQEHEFDYKKYFTLLTAIYHQSPQTRYLFYELGLELYEFYQELVKDAIEKGEIRDDIGVDSIVIFIQSIFKGYIDLWVYQPHCPFEKLVESNKKLVWEAIKKR